MPHPTGTPPSSYRVMQAVSAWQAARQRLLSDDSDLAYDERALNELLGPEEGDILDVLQRVLLATQHATVLYDGTREMMRDLCSRRDRFLARVEQFRATAFAIMDALGGVKYEFPHCTGSLHPSPRKVQILEPDDLPDEFVRIRREPNLDAINKALKAGQLVPGAQLGNSSLALHVRSK